MEHGGKGGEDEEWSYSLEEESIDVEASVEYKKCASRKEGGRS